jgi:hypothetical protein
MTEENESNRQLREVRPSLPSLWAQGLQWFGVVMILMAVGLAVFSNVTEATGGVTLIATFGMLGLLSLVLARCLVTLYPMSPGKKGGPKPPVGQH